MPNDLHNEHRKRVREDFLKHGFNESTPPHKIIEMLLFYSIPRKDTNELAHILLKRFGNIAGILEARPEELKKVKGIGDNTISLFKLILPLARIYKSDKNTETISFANMDEVCNFLLDKYFGYNKEVFAVTTFTGSGKMIAFDILSEGCVSSVSVSTRDVIETVLRRNAMCAIISHNHPDGTALPSISDTNLTENISSALGHINVKLLDHVIIAGDDYVSMAQSRGYRYIFDLA